MDAACIAGTICDLSPTTVRSAWIMRKWLQDVDFEDAPLVIVIVLIVAYLGIVFCVYGWPWH